MSWLENIRQKDAKAKKKFALITSASVTGVIFILWVFVLQTAGNPIKDQKKNSDVNPMAGIWSVFAQGWGTLVQDLKTKSNHSYVASTTTKDVLVDPVEQDVLILSGSESESQ